AEHDRTRLYAACPYTRAYSGDTSSSGWLRPKERTRAPSSTTIFTSARPMPVVPPVTRTRLFASEVWFVLSVTCLFPGKDEAPAGRDTEIDAILGTCVGANLVASARDDRGLG